VLGLPGLVDAVDQHDVWLIPGAPGEVGQRVDGGPVKDVSMQVELGSVAGTEKSLAARVESVGTAEMRAGYGQCIQPATGTGEVSAEVVLARRVHSSAICHEQRGIRRRIELYRSAFCYAVDRRTERDLDGPPGGCARLPGIQVDEDRGRDRRKDGAQQAGQRPTMNLRRVSGLAPGAAVDCVGLSPAVSPVVSYMVVRSITRSGYNRSDVEKPCWRLRRHRWRRCCQGLNHDGWLRDPLYPHS
jgi:hypothetical protein